MSTKGVTTDTRSENFEIKPEVQEIESIDVKKHLAIPKEEDCKSLPERTITIVSEEELQLSPAQISLMSTKLLNNQGQPVSSEEKATSAVAPVAKAPKQKKKKEKTTNEVFSSISSFFDKAAQPIKEFAKRREHFEKIKDLISDQNKTDRSELGKTLEEGIQADVLAPALANEESLKMFKVDNLRTVIHMVVKDGSTILDYQRNPNEEMSDIDRGSFCDYMLENFKKVVGNDDKKWLRLIQYMFCQLSEIRLFGDLKGRTLMLNDFVLMNTDRYELCATTPTAVRLTIQRNADKKIEKLHVEATNTSALFHIKADQNGVILKNEKVEDMDIVSALHFDISLNQNTPEVKVTTYRHKLL